MSSVREVATRVETLGTHVEDFSKQLSHINEALTKVETGLKQVLEAKVALTTRINALLNSTPQKRKRDEFTIDDEVVCMKSDGSHFSGKVISIKNLWVTVRQGALTEVFQKSYVRKVTSTSTVPPLQPSVTGGAVVDGVAEGDLIEGELIIG